MTDEINQSIEFPIANQFGILIPCEIKTVYTQTIHYWVDWTNGNKVLWSALSNNVFTWDSIGYREILGKSKQCPNCESIGKIN